MTTIAEMLEKNQEWFKKMSRATPAPAIVAVKPAEFVAQKGDILPLRATCVSTEQIYMQFPVLNKQEALEELDRSNPYSPFAKFVGNDDAVELICNKLAYALGREDHTCSANFALYGPGGVGKTQLAKNIAETLELPLVRIDAKSADLNSTYKLFVEIDRVLKQFNPALELVSGCAPESVGKDCSSNTFHLPACVVFFDEVHALNRSILSELLTATEKNDSYMRISIDGVSYTVYTERVIWIIATTDKGKISGPLKTRFTPVQLKPYGLTDLACLVTLKFRYPPRVCVWIAMHFRSSARATADFAADIQEEIAGLTEEEMLALISRRAKIMGLNYSGMSEHQRKVLELLLKHDTISTSNLADCINVGSEELVEDILPALKIEGEGYPRFIMTGPKGLSLTPEGREFALELLSE